MLDLVIIGGGPGGYVGAIRAGQLGLKTMLVEKDSVGGTCLNRGCIPTKSLISDAKLYKLAKASTVLDGVDNISININKMLERKRQVVTGLVKGVEGLLKANGVELARGTGSIKAQGVVVVTAADGSTREVQTKNILIATGSRPQVLPFLKIDGQKVQTTDEALDDANIPANIAIIGGGVIGVEMAGLFASLGRKVTIFEVFADVIMTEDVEVRQAMNSALKKQGVELYLDTKVQGVEANATGVTVTFAGADGKTKTASFDKLLAATGRAPVLDGIDVQALGLEKNGPFLKVDGHFQTKMPGVYAVGDVIGGVMLAHKASIEAEAAVEIIAGKGFHGSLLIPACIWGPVEVGSVGLSEAEAKKQGRDVRVGSFPYMASGAAKAKGKGEGFAKIVGDAKTGEILGAHIVGENATDMIAEAVTMMAAECVVEDFYQVVKPHPTLSEIMFEAAMDWNHKAVHKPPTKKA